MTLAQIATPAVEWYALAPLLVLLAGSCVCVLVAVLLPDGWKPPAGALVASGCFVGAGITAAVLFSDSETPESIVAGAAVRDQLGSLTGVILCGFGLVATAVAWRHGFKRHGAEYYALLLAAAAGMVFLVQATNLMTLFLGLEWFSISLYILCAYDVRREGSLEAGLKYLVVGGFGSAVLLFGSAFVYGATGELGFSEIAAATSQQDLGRDLFLLAGLAMVVVGLGFKVSAAPFHMWTPDVYEGAPTPVTAFMSAATKAAALALTLRLLVTAFPEEAEVWTIALAVIACVSLAVGNLTAIVQTNVKRLLAYSSIAQAGFMLIAVASANETSGTALLFFLIPYGAASIGAFAVVAARERELGRPATLEWRGGLCWGRPLLGGGVWVLMLCLRIGLGPRLGVADRRRRRRDGSQPLLLPRRHPGHVHAAGCGARSARRRPAAEGACPVRGRPRIGGRRRRFVLRRRAARRPREGRGRLAELPVLDHARNSLQDRV